MLFSPLKLSNSLVFGLCLWLLCGALPSAQAQLARKPSYYDAQREPALVANPAQPAAATPGPLEAMRRTAKGSLASLPDQAGFDQLARVYNPGTPMALPHVLFVIDLKARPARIYYLDTPRYQLHVRFVRDTGLAPHAGKRDIDSNYLLPGRRFLFGTLSWQSAISSFTYEFWEGDQLTAPLLRQAEKSVAASFFAPVKFKANSTLHERRAREAGIDMVTQEALISRQPYLPLNLGTAVGRVRVVEQAASVNALLPGDIAVLRQVPLSLPPVAGVLTERPSTALSHVNLLAKGWGIPNAYVQNAAAELRQHEGKWVELKVSASGYALRRLSDLEVAAALPRPGGRGNLAQSVGIVKTPRPDLREQRLLPLSALRGAHRAQCGAKAANLGLLQSARIAQTFVPDGFCIPFSHYQRFAQANGLAGRLVRMQDVPGFQDDPQIRLAALAQLRAEMLQWPVDSKDAAAWQARWQSQLRGAGVFVRSSSNSEDLPGFSGAGLYSTVPNVKAEAALAQAVKNRLGLRLQPRGLGSAQRRRL
ncbi:MAG: putative PEP/pyruvate-binding pyruvate phosphate dikinase [Polaromonas sp.]|nr:putative PEP/pyruvate-binding pyruvate phosphate dikinase [Polaromonas sp.]